VACRVRSQRGPPVYARMWIVRALERQSWVQCSGRTAGCPYCFRHVKRSTLPEMPEHFAPSIAQLKMTIDRIAAMETEAQEIARLMYAGYGADDRRAIRAGEMLAAIQRLRWELEPNRQQERHAIA
jgi:hypothetical protein